MCRTTHNYYHFSVCNDVVCVPFFSQSTLATLSPTAGALYEHVRYILLVLQCISTASRGLEHVLPQIPRIENLPWYILVADPFRVYATPHMECVGHLIRLTAVKGDVRHVRTHAHNRLGYDRVGVGSITRARHQIFNYKFFIFVPGISLAAGGPQHARLPVSPTAMLPFCLGSLKMLPSLPNSR